MINRTIKGYEIKQLIATGGMAAIYRALSTTTGQTVAIKILHGHLAQDKDFITRFEREARAAADLKHENIIDITMILDGRLSVKIPKTWNIP